jgi:hypothetical protein
MDLAGDEWENRLAALWRSHRRGEVADIVAAVDEVTTGRSDGAALFERASTRDSAGRTSEAVPLYLQALRAGLDPWQSHCVTERAHRPARAAD